MRRDGWRSSVKVRRSRGGLAGGMVTLGSEGRGRCDEKAGATQTLLLLLLLLLLFFFFLLLLLLVLESIFLLVSSLSNLNLDLNLPSSDHDHH